MNYTMEIMFLVLIYSIYGLSITSATDFLNCTDGTAPINLVVLDCDKQPCLFHKGKNAVMVVDFEVDHNVETLTASILAHIPGSVVPYPLPEPNACLGLINGECPLDKGEEVSYKLKMPVLESFPEIKVLIEFYLKDENKNVITCFKLAAQVTN